MGFTTFTPRRFCSAREISPIGIVGANLPTRYLPRLPTASRRDITYQILSIRDVTTQEVIVISADLGKRLESYVAQLVEAGRYGSKSEVLREGVRLVEEREKRLAVLDAAIERGLADVEHGRTHALEDVAVELTRSHEGTADP